MAKCRMMVVAVFAAVLVPAAATAAAAPAKATVSAVCASPAFPPGSVFTRAVAFRHCDSSRTRVLASSDEFADVVPGVLRPGATAEISIFSAADPATPFDVDATVTTDAPGTVITDTVVSPDEVDATITTPADEQILTITVTNPDGHIYVGLIDVRRRTGEFHPMSPTRLLDTRVPEPMHSGPEKLSADRPRSLLISGGLNGPLMGMDVGSIVVNVTIVDPAAAGFLTAWPAGSPRPDASSINYAAGRTVANLVTVAVGTSPVSPGVVGPSPFRAVQLVASTTTDVIVDVVGWYAAASAPSMPDTTPVASAFVPIEPERRSDTRFPMANPGNVSRFAVDGPLHTGETRRLSLDSTTGEFDGVDAVALNVTVSGATASGYLTVWPGDQPKPDASNINFAAGDAIPNMVIVPISALHQLNVYNSAGDTDVIVDLVGFYETDFFGGLLFASTTPTRVIDSRLGRVLPARPLNAGETVFVSVGTGPAPVAVVMNTVIVGSTTPTGYITVYPADMARPDVSNLNVQLGRAAANQVIVPLSQDGANAMAIFNANGPADLIADLTGFFY